MTQQFEPFQKVLVRDTDDQLWRACLFSHMETQSEHPYKAILSSWVQCIPYEGNEHLLGTADSPTPPEPEQNFKFGDKVEVSVLGDKWYEAVYLYRSIERHIAVQEKGRIAAWKYCRKADW